MPEQIVFLNDEFLPLSQAKVSVLDRGFVFGDGVYEVIPAYGGQLFRIDEHLRRLQDSLDAIRLPNPHDRSQWLAILNRLLTQHGGDDQSVYLQLTRGVAPRDHAFPKHIQPTVFAMANRMEPTDPQYLQQGIAAVSLPDSRWQHCNIKGISLLAGVLLRQQAEDQQAMEAILIRDGQVTEGAASNIFIVEQGVIKTPPKGQHLLPGITRDLLVELAQQNQLAVSETTVSEQALLAADEIWLSSSGRELLPVTTLNHRPVGTGKPGPLWQTMYTLFQACKAQLRKPA